MYDGCPKCAPRGKKTTVSMHLKGLVYDWGSLWVLWNTLPGGLLLAQLRKAPGSRRYSSLSYQGPAQAHLTAPTRLLIASTSHPKAQHPGLGLLLSITFPDKHIWQAPRDRFTRRLCAGKCFGIYEMLYRWVLSWLLIKICMCLCVSLARNELRRSCLGR